MTFCEHLNRLLWLFDTITTYGPISLKDINRRWLRRTGSLGNKIDRQAFSREKKVIEEVFDLEIVIVERDKYVVKDPQHNVHKLLQKQMLANIHESNLLSNFKALGSCIRIPEINKGTEYLYTIGEAMHESKTLTMMYQKYDDEAPYTAEVEPYCLKLFSLRWYMFARKTIDQNIKCFSLDRVKGMDMTDRTFQKNTGFDPDKYFDNYYGVYIGNLEPEDVLIRTTKKSMKYLLDLNMHSSQDLIDEDVASQMLSQRNIHYNKNPELAYYFRFYIAPTPDFENEIIRLCENCEVLYPLWLREKLYRRMQKALSNMEKASNANTDN